MRVGIHVAVLVSALHVMYIMLLVSREPPASDRNM